MRVSIGCRRAGYKARVVFGTVAAAVLLLASAGCGKTAERKDVDTVQTAAAAPDVIRGTFTDTRDAKTYRTVGIGKLTWMAENLNFATDSSRCYDNADSNCTKYGRLYNWDDAMKACPVPWRVPSDEDWGSLTVAVGGQRVKDKDGDYYWKFAGRKLKSTTGWIDREWKDDDGNQISGNGTDDFGFSALPGGDGRSGGYFYNAGLSGYWWSATEDAASNAWNRGMGYDIDSVRRDIGNKTDLLSVRCIRDVRP
ncbi:MAG: fibrobacter succinogenes major paralogous domain-containing protein [Chitinispirillia bacterium]|nr:fibrobacter succinogenes major paralogous domain-containing protein [Chitinispirillia bacterium]MCL2269659.1 fibrobacter succinogenes major paralogous domain-containing protein [Chitinispirillia bacterium]